MRMSRWSWLYVALFFLAPSFALAQENGDAGVMSLDDLLSVEISSAAKYAQTTAEAAASVTVITREDMEVYGYRTLQEALAQVRGLYQGYDRNYTYLGTRGFSRPGDYNNRALLMVDGHVINENFYGSAVMGEDFAISLDMVERIEVVRGPGSALYGSNAMFAVINVISREGRDVQGLEAVVDGGRFGAKRASALFGREFDNGLNLMVSGSWYDASGQDLYFPEFDEPETNNGVAEGMDFERSGGGYATLRYGPFTFSGMAMSREKAIPTGAWETLFNVEQTTIDRQWFADSRFEKELGARGHFLLRGYLNGYSYDGVYPYEDQYTETDRNESRWQGVEGQLRWDLSEANRLTVGSEFTDHSQARYFYEGDGEVYFDGDFPFRLFSAFVQDEIHLGSKWTVTVGGRYDQHSDVESAFTPRAALLFHPTDGLTLKGLYGEGFRAPSRYESHYDDGWNIANPTVGPERVRTAEVVAEQRFSDRFHGTASLFSYRVTDLIDQVEIDGGENYQFQNSGTVDASGVEMELTYRGFNGVSGYVSHVYQSVEWGGGGALSNSPENITRMGLSVPVWGDVTVSAFGIHETARLTLWETETDPFTLVNLTLSTRQWLDPLSLSITLKNLLDEEYALPAGWEVPLTAVPQDGRSFRVSLGVAF